MSFLSPQAPRLWRIGAGHVARSSAALARNVGFDVTSRLARSLAEAVR
jgi:hypothetical protein